MKIKSYSKTELALMYGPCLSERYARRRLMDWITDCKPLITALMRLGYRPEQRIFTPLQVATIFQYLGEP